MGQASYFAGQTGRKPGSIVPFYSPRPLACLGKEVVLRDES